MPATRVRAEAGSRMWQCEGCNRYQLQPGKEMPKKCEKCGCPAMGLAKLPEAPQSPKQ